MNRMLAWNRQYRSRAATALTIALAWSTVGFAVTTAAPDAIPLSGQWHFSLDRSDQGIEDKWYQRDLPNRIQLPGDLQSQGYGDKISVDTPWVLSLYDRLWYERAEYRDYTQPGNVKVPFLCQPPRHYLGVAWYQRTIEIPMAWQGLHVKLFLERTRWESTVWVDDRQIGSNNSLVAPHEYDLGILAPGSHRLSVRIDNRMLMRYRPRYACGFRLPGQHLERHRRQDRTAGDQPRVDRRGPGFPEHPRAVGTD